MAWRDDRRRRPMKWKDLSGMERYRVVELARSGQVNKTEMCRTFGVSRQTLNRAIRHADEASMEALEPKKAGRPGKSTEKAELTELKQDYKKLQKKLKEAEQRFEVAKAFLELERKLDRGEPLPGEKAAAEKKRRTRKKPRWRKIKSRSATRGSGRTGTAPGMEPTSDGADARHPAQKPGAVAKPEAEGTE
jgi:transposase-like protein